MSIVVSFDRKYGEVVGVGIAHTMPGYFTFKSFRYPVRIFASESRYHVDLVRKNDTYNCTISLLESKGVEYNVEEIPF